DCFAGSGALGFEALSRGAQLVILAEQDRQATQLLNEHARTLSAAGSGQALVQPGDVLNFSKRQLSSLRQLAEFGVGLALNEFGRSAGALQFILSYPFTHVKLDPNFVADIANSDRAQKMVRNVVNLCTELDIQVVAAGVDEQAQQDALLTVGVVTGQGKQFGEPVRVHFDDVEVDAAEA
ncbi:hypothetical protein C9986_02935, partial [Pseudidiomarina aestuarii]